tara:strand:- start:334 stop:651 length:318 start_codon:yes stop_codon:yes gene_type:complete
MRISGLTPTRREALDWALDSMVDFFAEGNENEAPVVEAPMVFDGTTVEIDDRVVHDLLDRMDQYIGMAGYEAINEADTRSEKAKCIACVRAAGWLIEAIEDGLNA